MHFVVVERIANVMFSAINTVLGKENIISTNGQEILYCLRDNTSSLLYTIEDSLASCISDELINIVDILTIFVEELNELTSVISSIVQLISDLASKRLLHNISILNIITNNLPICYKKSNRRLCPCQFFSETYIFYLNIASWNIH